MNGPIWQYQAETQSAPLLKKAFEDRLCPCCGGGSRLIPMDRESQHLAQRYSAHWHVTVCPQCGWWLVVLDQIDTCGTADHSLRSTLATGAALTLLDPIFSQTQLDQLCLELERHLEGHGKSDHWKIMEDAIAAILRNLGVSVIQTGRRGDGGIDLLLRTTNVPLGVGQVKHSKNKIGVSVLRELVGTSMLNNSKHGILVASSKFTSGAYGVQDLAKQNAGLSIELIDGPEVLKALKLTTRTAVTRLGDLSGIAHPAVHIIYEAVPV